DGKSGYLVEPDDYAGFADRIVSILENKTLAEELGRNAREMVLNKFLNTRLMGDYLDLVNELTS
ncbi:MAG: glycosyltransferase family 4 protein, partial [bacterium]|nr:glycosyltransferase family 4 protein [bacterium]